MVQNDASQRRSAYSEFCPSDWMDDKNAELFDTNSSCSLQVNFYMDRSSKVSHSGIGTDEMNTLQRDFLN